jgi:biopolymer transport protein ExbD
MADFQRERVIVIVQRMQGGTLAANEPELRLNSRPVSWRDLSNLLRTELSRHPDRVVYVEGEGDLEVGDIVRVVDVAREAWYGVPVVLLTPKLKKSLEAERAGARQDRPSKLPPATQIEPRSKSR